MHDQAVAAPKLGYSLSVSYEHAILQNRWAASCAPHTATAVLRSANGNLTVWPSNDLAIQRFGHLTVFFGHKMALCHKWLGLISKRNLHFLFRLKASALGNVFLRLHTMLLLALFALNALQQPKTRGLILILVVCNTITKGIFKSGSAGFRRSIFK